MHRGYVATRKNTGPKATPIVGLAIQPIARSAGWVSETGKEHAIEVRLRLAHNE